MEFKHSGITMIRNSRFIILSLLLISAFGGLWFARAPIEAAFRLLYPLRPSDPSAQGLVGYWSFDASDISGTTAKDRSGNGNSATITEATQVAGQISGALTFDGVNDDISVADASSLDLSTAGTVSFWYKKGASGNEMAITKWTTSGNQKSYVLQNDNDNKIYWNVSGTGADIIYFTSTATYTDTDWHYLAGVYNGSSLLVYRDGVLVAGTITGTVPSSIFNSTSVVKTSYDGANFNTGSIDDVRIYNRALTADEIKEYYDATASANRATAGAQTRGNTSPTGDVTSGLVGYWTFDGSKLLQNAVDSSGQGNTGYLVNIATTTAVTEGIHGQALTFDGVNDYVNVTSSSSIVPGSSSWSVAVWAKLPNIDQNAPILAKRENGGDFRQFGIGVGGTDTHAGSSGKRVHCLFLDVSETTERTSYTSSDVIDGSWHHISCVWDKDANDYFTYVDGSPVSITKQWNAGSWPTIDNTDALRIGNSAASSYLNGQVDEARVYNRALSTTEVQTLYTRGAAGRSNLVNSSPTTSLTSGLVGYWTFDGKDTPWTSATAATTLDRSGNGKTGTLNNMNRDLSVIEGIHGQGLSFDGSDDYVSTTASLSNLSSLTLSGWVYPRTSGTRLGFFGQNDAIEFGFNDSDTILFWTSGGDTLTWDFTTSTFPLNRWHLVTAVANGSQQILYVDGVSVASVSAVASNYGSSADTVNIGARVLDPTGGNLNAIFDDVRIYNRALSASEVSQLYNAGR